MILLAVLYFVAGAIAGAFVVSVLASYYVALGPVATLRFIERRLKLARFKGTPLESVIEDVEIVRRRLETATWRRKK